jgi:hypothetical protein
MADLDNTRDKADAILFAARNGDDLHPVINAAQRLFKVKS